MTPTEPTRHRHPLELSGEEMRALGKILGQFEKVLIPELNMGQRSLLIRGKFLIDAQPMNKVQGKPLLVRELLERFDTML